MNVANMSLGGGTHGNQDLLTVGVDNLTAAGMVSRLPPATPGRGRRPPRAPALRRVP